MAESKLKRLCTEDNKVRENYFSDTYRAKLKIGGELKEWDITHISLPFENEKEQALIDRFGIAEEDLTEFYSEFGEQVIHEIALHRFLRGTKDEAAISNTINYVYIDKAEKEGRGSDLYMVSDTMEPLIGSEFIQKDSVSLLNLLQIAARLTQTLKLYQGIGLHIGAFDLDTIYLAEHDGRSMMTVGSLLYGVKEGETGCEVLATAPACMFDEVKSGAAQSNHSDLYAVCAMLWVLADGKHHTEKADLNESPEYAPEELTDLLMKGMTDKEITAKEIHSGLHAIIRKVRKGEIEDVIIPIAPMTSKKAETKERLDQKTSPEVTENAEMGSGVAVGTQSHNDPKTGSEEINGARETNVSAPIAESVETKANIRSDAELAQADKTVEPNITSADNTSAVNTASTTKTPPIMLVEDEGEFEFISDEAPFDPSAVTSTATQEETGKKKFGLIPILAISGSGAVALALIAKFLVLPLLGG